MVSVATLNCIRVKEIGESESREEVFEVDRWIMVVRRACSYSCLACVKAVIARGMRREVMQRCAASCVSCGS